jgi:hypothetical protein
LDKAIIASIAAALAYFIYSKRQTPPAPPAPPEPGNGITFPDGEEPFPLPADYHTYWYQYLLEAFPDTPIQVIP